ncbi:MAG: histidine ammonia-lyase [Calditrichaceae bacterium]
MQPLVIDENDLTLTDIEFFLEHNPPVKISESVIRNIERSREIITGIVESGKTVYGVNTGFGKFSNVKITRDKVEDLQRRLVLSHAAGVGDPAPEPLVRLMMLLKIKNLSQGYSGIRYSTVQLLLDMLNNNITPLVPAKGSVGASGDLAPLAHMSLPLIGEGNVFLEGKKLPSIEALKTKNLSPIQLGAKEGLALLNGTQTIQAYGLWNLVQAYNLVKTADIIGAVSLEALLGTLTAFDERIQNIRRQPGQRKVAENFRNILKDSPIVASHKDDPHKVQDAYSLRCIPQVHGAVRDGLDYVKEVFEREMNGVTDNPLIFPDQGDVLSGGNFHGEPVALAADYLGILMAELANLSERRIEHMMDPAESDLVAFLAKDGGLNSGFMIAHVTSAALVSENKVLAHPASVDSIPTSANKEDHVSMGTHAARKAMEIISNTENVLAIEFLCACQALELRAPLKPSGVTGEILALLREQVAYLENDRFMHPDITKACKLISAKKVVRKAEELVSLQ